jgi:ferredoxin
MRRLEYWPKTDQHSEAIMHITVDYHLCEGHGQCLLAAPEIFDVSDDTGQVVVLVANPPESARDQVVRATAMCPAQALQVGD